MKSFKSLNFKEKMEYIGIRAIHPLILLYAQLGKSVKFLNTRARQITASVLAVCLMLTMIPLSAITAFATTADWSYPTSTPTEPFADGTGEESDPYIIATAQQLANMAYLVNNDNANYGGKHYKLSANIDLAGGDWTPISASELYFSGVFDGANYTISNLTISDGEDAGLFGYIEDGTVKNLTLKDVDINGNLAGGVLAAGYPAVIDNCTVSGSISGEYCAGGIIGFIRSATITNCVNTATVSATVIATEEYASANAGGIAGSIYNGGIGNCYNIGTVTASASGDYRRIRCYAGGIAGSMDSPYMSNCYNIGVVSATNTSTGADPDCYDGALAGDSGGNIENCYWLSGSATSPDGNGYAYLAYCDSFENSTDTVSYNGATDEVSLLEALNAWVTAQNAPELRTWKVSAGENNGYPVLADYYKRPADYTIYLVNGEVRKYATDGDLLTAAENPGITVSGNATDGWVYTFTNVSFTTTATQGICFEDTNATMMLVGDNTVTGGSDSTGPVYGLNAGNALTIDGDGSLKVTAGNGPEVYGVFARRGLTVENGDITITTGNASSNITYGIYARGENSVVIKGGNITATAGNAPNNISFGVYAYNSMVVEGGILKAYSGNASSDAYGIYADVNLNISGGEVYAEAKTATDSYGIYNRSYGSAAMNITGGSVTGVGDTAGIYSENPVLAANAPLTGSDSKDGTNSAAITNWDGTNSTKKWMQIAVPTHTHDNITFNKEWTAKSGELASGNYYLTESNATVLTANITIPENATVNLCLNGHTLNLGNGYIKIGKNAIFTICDCSAEKAGKITGGGSYCIYNDYGTFAMTGGAIESTSIYANASGIYNNHGTATLSGGTVTATTYGIYNNAAALEIYGDAKVTSPSAAIRGANTCFINIYGNAEISTTTKLSYATGYGIYINDETGGEGEMNIYGNAKVSGASIGTGEGYGIYSFSKTLTINIYDNAKVSGTSVSGTVYGIKNCGTVHISGNASVSGTESRGTGYGIFNNTYYCTVKVSGGTVAGSNNGIWNMSLCTVALMGGTVSGSVGVTNSYGTIYLSDSPILLGTDADIKATGGILYAHNAENTLSFAGETVTVDASSREVGDAIVNGVTDGNKDKFTVTDTDYKLKQSADALFLAYADETPPTGQISIGINHWENFLNRATFGLFFKDYKYIEITGSDTETGIKSREYYLSATPVSFEDIKKSDIPWTTYSGRVKIEPDNQYFVYAKITDKADNVTYIDTDGIVLDDTAPTLRVTVGTDTFDDNIGRYYFITGEKPQSYTADDTRAGVEKVEYLDAAEELEDAELDNAAGWQPLNNGDMLPYVNGTVYHRYYRAIDKAGNAAYVYLGAVVCYADHTGEAFTADYTYGSKDDVSVDIELDAMPALAYRYISMFDKLTLADSTKNYPAADGYAFYELSGKQGFGIKLADGSIIESILANDHTATSVTLRVQPLVTAGVDFYGDIPAALPIKITVKPTAGEVKDISDISKTYDGTAVSTPTYAALGNGAVTVEYKAADADDAAYTTVAPIKAGEYTVKVSVAASQPYMAAAATKHFTIEKATPVIGEVSVSGPEHIYFNTALDSLVLDRTDTSIAGELKLAAGQSLLVGTRDYSWSFTPDDTDNYTKATGKLSITVEKIQLDVSGVAWHTAGSPFPYDATAKRVTLTGSLPAGVVVEKAGETATAAGNYTATATFTLAEGYDAQNYEIVGAADNKVSANWAITPKAITPIIQVADGGVYDGTEKTPTVKVYDGAVEIPAEEYTVSYADNINAGTATVTVTDKAGGNYTINGTESFVINKADYPVAWPQNLTGSQGDTLSSVALGAGFQWEAADAIIQYGPNTYAITYTPADTGNYKVAQSNITVTGADVTAPTGVIALKNNKWNAFWNNLTFGLFFKETQSITITAADTESGIKEIAYYLATEELSKDDVKALENSKWTVYADAFNVEPDNKYVVYARITDNAGNVIYINSDGIVLDSIKPVIAGVEDGKDVYGDAAFTVDESNLDTITLDGAPMAVKDGKYSVPADNKEHTIVITDKTGHTVTYKLTVYKTYNVSFMVDGKEIKASEIGHGQDAALPEIPAKVGYTAKWDAAGKHITADTVITAVYEKIPESPQTGDDTNVWLWIAAVLVSGIGLVTAAGYGKKKKQIK